MWGIGFLAMFVPFAYVIVGLSRLYPQEGGIYVWSKEAFGDFAGFLTGWTYWMSNLPYFPGVLYFAVSSALWALPAAEGRAPGGVFYAAAATAGLLFATLVHVVGLETGKWLTNAAAAARAAATLVLCGLAAVVWWRHGSATAWSGASLAPGFHVRDLVFWSTIAFAWTGLEAAGFLGEEIVAPRRNVPRAIGFSTPVIAAIYVGGTAAILVLVPAAGVNALDGVMQAVRSGAERVGVGALVPVVAILVAVSSLGSVGTWLAAVARLPFVAGIDRYLPPAFGRLHPRFRSPHVALWTQAAVTLAVIALGQAGTTVRGAYDVLISLTVIATFIPFLFTFAAAGRMLPAAARTGGLGRRLAARVLPALGFSTTAASIVLAAVPAADEPRKELAVAKIFGATAVMLAAGVLFYRAGRKPGSARWGQS